MSYSFTTGKVDAARHEKNLWRRRASSAEIALNRIKRILDHADEEAGAEGARPDEDLLQDIWTAVADWEDAQESQSSLPIKSMKVKAYIFPLTDEERGSAEAALQAWLDGDEPVPAGVAAVLKAVAALRDPAQQRGAGL